MTRYRLFGLTVDSDVDLDAAPSDAVADVMVSREPDVVVSDDRPEGRLVAEIRAGDGTAASYTVVRPDGTCRLTIAGMAQFDIDVAGGTIRYRADPSLDRGLIPLLVAGIVLGTYLELREQCILHASAVYSFVLRGAVAFTGASGMGKSTIATLMAADGSPLIADDILRVARGGSGGYVAHRGTSRTRLRPQAESLAEVFRGSRITADGRLTAELPTYDADSAPLAAIVVPLPDKDRPDLDLATLHGAEALMTLLAFPRIEGWRDQGPRFAFLAELVQQVPIFAIRLPWGPPFPPDLARQLVVALRHEL